MVKRPDPTAPDIPPDPPQRTRRRMTLNMSIKEYRTLEKIAEHDNCSIMTAIKRSAETRWRLITAQNPHLRWDPEERPAALPNPAYIAWIDEVTGERTRLETV